MHGLANAWINTWKGIMRGLLHEDPAPPCADSISSIRGLNLNFLQLFQITIL